MEQDLVATFHLDLRALKLEYKTTCDALKNWPGGPVEEQDFLEQQLTTELDEVRLMHSKMVEIARVCTFLNTKVQEQHVQVENMNTEAHRSTEYIKKGQIQLEEAVQSKKSSRKVFFYFFVIMGCSLLFLDWYM